MNRKFHEIEVIQTEKEALYLRVDGEMLRIAWADCSPQLVKASAIEREIVEITPSGYGLHWPLLDEDLAIEPFLTHARTVEISGMLA